MPRAEWYSEAHVARRSSAAGLHPLSTHALAPRDCHRCVLLRRLDRPASGHRGHSSTHRARDDDDHVASAASPAEHAARRRIPPLVSLTRRNHEDTKTHEVSRSMLFANLASCVFVFFVTSWFLFLAI